MKSKNQKILEMSRKQDVQPDELAEYIYSKINFTLPHNMDRDKQWLRRVL